MKQIKTFEDACKAKGLDPLKVIPDVSAFPAEHQKALIATAKLFIIADAVNDGWVPDWNNDDEYKYYPWFDMEKTDENASGFSLNRVYYLSDYDCRLPPLLPKQGKGTVGGRSFHRPVP